MFRSASDEISFSLPADVLVVKRNRTIDLYAVADDDTFFHVTKWSVDPTSQFEITSSSLKAPNATVNEYKIGSYHIRQVDHRLDKGFATSFYTVTGRAYYVLSITGRERGNTAVKRFMDSISFGQRLLFGNQNLIDKPGPEAEVLEKLRSSSAVEAALKRRCSDQINVTYASTPEEWLVPPLPEFARPVVVVRRPERERGAFGTPPPDYKVNLRVNYGSNGCVTSVVVLEGEKWAVKAVVRELKETKFVPAELKGKPIDSVMRF